MPATPCLDCGRPTTNGTRCDEHRRAKVRQRSKQRGSPSAQGYDRAWKQVRAAAIAAQPYCSQCGSQNDLTGDHIVPLSLGGASSPENVRVLCRRCNSRRGNRS